MAEFALIACVGFFVVVSILLVLFYIVSIFNGLISLKNNIDKSWANIDVVLKQRSDLIPNLVETVKGYAKYEKGVLEDLTKLRTAMMSATGPSEKARANDALSASLKSIFAVAENYPKLQANENFLKLQEQLTAMENQIADRREFYNDSVVLYNTRIASIPDSFAASMLGMQPKEYFKATEDEKKLVEVKIEN
ncbi:LemA family protein [Candidatus Bilamarchaeum dharawalense]|uniref:LemA family protein n=1 Tax=Candidatus Bilamarchaeum dharawalense TaxID=2885759 RepID=A0A5E4LME4_9ARCH|nr:LemA family protein [Candidatus Bilamarchaeum dharawalense]